jgi:hypothetical protein
MTSNQRPWLTTWRIVLTSLHTLMPNDLVCFDDGPRLPDDPCLIVDGTQLGEEEDVPSMAEERGWTTALSKEELQGVLSNLSKQVDSPDLTLIVRAVAHYVDNDSYLRVT